MKRQIFSDIDPITTDRHFFKFSSQVFKQPVFKPNLALCFTLKSKIIINKVSFVRFAEKT
ncbi:MAG: hypothetical protein IPM57_05555 [Oligoflexia bacterium]|nr:hypothetical protein [Oligoflexia bacterium]